VKQWPQNPEERTDWETFCSVKRRAKPRKSGFVSNISGWDCRQHRAGLLYCYRWGKADDFGEEAEYASRSGDRGR
jgi:hypothetical protein